MAGGPGRGFDRHSGLRGSEIGPEARALASARNQALNPRTHLRQRSGARCSTGSCACLREAWAMAVRPQS